MEVKGNNESHGHGVKIGYGDSLVPDSEQACSTSGYPPQHTYLAQVAFTSFDILDLFNSSVFCLFVEDPF